MAQTDIMLPNADGRLQQFTIFPGDADAGKVITRWETKAGGPWSGWVELDSGAVVTVSRGLSGALGAGGIMTVMAAAAPVFKKVPVKISQVAPNSGWGHFSTF